MCSLNIKLCPPIEFSWNTIYPIGKIIAITYLACSIKKKTSITLWSQGSISSPHVEVRAWNYKKLTLGAIRLALCPLHNASFLRRKENLLLKWLHYSFQVCEKGGKQLLNWEDQGALSSLSWHREEAQQEHSLHFMTAATLLCLAPVWAPQTLKALTQVTFSMQLGS